MGGEDSEAASVVQTVGEEGKLPAVASEQMPTSDKCEPVHQPSKPTATSPGLFTEAELHSLQAVLPSYLLLAEIPADVARAWLLWRGLPITYVKGTGPYSGWRYSEDLKTSERFKTFWDLKENSAILLDWLFAHHARKITAQNLLNVWG